MIDKLQAELAKLQDNLQTVEFKIGDNEYKFYFRYLTLFEKIRIEQSCIKTVTTINPDGSKTVENKENKELIPIYTILEKALDENGKRLFSNTNPEHFKLVSGFPIGVASQLAYLMSQDIFGTLKESNE